MSNSKPEILGYYTKEEQRKAVKYLNILTPTPKFFTGMISNFVELSLMSDIKAPPNDRGLRFSLGSEVLLAYNDVRFIRPFTPAELEKLESVLPSEKHLLDAINDIEDEAIYIKLEIKSLVTMMCEDFPHLEGLNYCAKIQEIDNFLEEVSQMDEVPFEDYRDIHETRRKCKLLGRIHPWWNIDKTKVVWDKPLLEDAVLFKYDIFEWRMKDRIRRVKKYIRRVMA